MGQRGQSNDDIKRVYACDHLVNINVQWQICSRQQLHVLFMWSSHRKGFLIVGVLLLFIHILCLGNDSDEAWFIPLMQIYMSTFKKYIFLHKKETIL